MSHLRDCIAGLRAQAKAHRDAARRLRAERARLGRLPIGRREPFMRLRLLSAIHERERLAAQCDAAAREARATGRAPW